MVQLMKGLPDTHMADWHVFSPDHEIPGQILIDLANAVGSEEILPFYQAHSLTNIDPKAWYPQQTVLDIYGEMASRKGGSMFDFVSIGIKEAEQAIIPPHFLALPLLTNLQSIGEVFKLNNRGTDVGEIRCETISDHHVKMIMRIPQPDDIWYGIFYGYVRRFIPRGADFTVTYDPAVPRRDKGGDVTIIHIKWN